MCGTSDSRMGTPAIYGSILAWITHQVRSGRHETVAWALCHLLTSVMVLFPVVVVLLNGFVFRSTTNRVAQLCAVHICWNAHTFTMMVMVWPFLLYKAQSGVGTYGEVLYDAACVDIFVVAPVVIATGRYVSQRSRLDTFASRTMVRPNVLRPRPAAQRGLGVQKEGDDLADGRERVLPPADRRERLDRVALAARRAKLAIQLSTIRPRPRRRQRRKSPSSSGAQLKHQI